MESKFQTSFIPKKSLDTKSGVKVKTPINVLSLMALVLTVAVLLLTGGVFFYKTLVLRDIEAKKDELKKAQGGFDYQSAENITRFDSKLGAAEDLLSSHLAVSNFFSFLEESTLERLRFSEFVFSAASNDRIAVTMKGQAKSYEVVAKQSEEFAAASAAGANFVNPIFSDLDLDDFGNITFTFLASMNPRMLLYEYNLEKGEFSSFNN